MERYFRVRGKERVRRILDAIQASGGVVLDAPDPSVAPFEFRVKTRSGEVLNLLCYVFTANKYKQRGRPADEHRFQIKYGSEFKRAHQIYVDPSGGQTTLMFGVHDDLDVFVAVDPTAHNPTWFSSSVEFKEADLQEGTSGWHGWERERQSNGRRRAGPMNSSADENFSTEVLVAFNSRHFLDFAKFERVASGMDAGERLLLSDKVGSLIKSPKRLGRLLQWPPRLDQPDVTALHPLLAQLGLTTEELLATLQSRFRLLAAVRGSVAEVHLGRHLRSLPEIDKVEHMDLDGQPDFLVNFGDRTFRVECKNVLRKRQGIAPRVDFQKTRASKSSPCSRYYDAGQFEVLAACLHPNTEKWEFRFCATAHLAPHKKCPGKLSERVLVAGDQWYDSLPELLRSLL